MVIKDGKDLGSSNGEYVPLRLEDLTKVRLSETEGTVVRIESKPADSLASEHLETV